MEWTTILGFVIIFGFFIGFIGYVADFDYLESKLLSTLFPEKEHTFPLIENIQEKIVVDSLPKIEEDTVIENVEESVESILIQELTEESSSNENICLAIIGKLFTNLNPTESELEEIEKELKENKCGDQ